MGVCNVLYTIPAIFKILLQPGQQQIQQDRQGGDENAPRRGHGRIVDGNAPVDGHAQAP